MEGETLLNYPCATFRLACRYCPRVVGAYRLVRLAVKFGCEAWVSDVVVKLAADCPHWKRNRRWPEGCGVYLPDLEPPRRLPDDPGARTIRLIKGGKDGRKERGKEGGQ